MCKAFNIKNKHSTIIKNMEIFIGMFHNWLKPLFTIYLKFKWINYEAEFSSILIMKHTFNIFKIYQKKKYNYFEHKLI